MAAFSGKILTRTYAGLILGLFMAASSYPALAQTTMMTDFLPSMNFINRQNDVLWGGYQKKTSNPSSRVRSTQTNSLTYVPSLARRKQNLAQFVASSRAQNPAGAGKMEQMFATTDIIAAIGKTMTSVGFRSDNLADAYAVYWSSAWLASASVSVKLTREQFAKIKAQAETAFVATPNIIGASDEKKQQFAEALLVQAVLISGSVESAKGNATQLKAVAAAVREGAKAAGLDLDAMILTDEGFIPAQNRRP